jgi:uridine kinase
MSRCFVIGIAGGSGSGKSTVVNRILTSRYGSEVVVLPHDAYYHNSTTMPLEVHGNWDHPDALDNKLFVEHLDTLRQGEAIHQPVYDFATHSRSDRSVRIGPGRVIVAEGILLFAIPEIVQCLDLRVFVDTPAEERLIRRLKRDVDERGRSPGSVIEQFRSSVRPMHDEFVRPSRVHAHLIIPWDFGPENTPAVDVLIARIGQVLSS